MRILSLITVVLSSIAANAAVAHECGSLDSIGNLVDNLVMFRYGGVKVAHVSTEEPAASSDHILVFTYNDEAGGSCTAISNGAAFEGQGFANINMKTLKQVSYDAEKGVLLQVKVGIPNGENSMNPKSADLKIRANYETGKVTLE